MKKNPFLVFLICCLMLGGTFSCTRVFRVAKPTKPVYYKQTFASSPNDIYYALRWALRTYGYPIAEEDLKNGVLKSRYVPIKSTSHYVYLFGRPDYGVNAAYHQLEVRLVPKGDKTEVQIGSRVESVVSTAQSAGTEERMILVKVGDYLRNPNAQVTNVGVQQ